MIVNRPPTARPPSRRLVRVQRTSRQKVGLLAGPVVFLVILAAPIDSMTPEAQGVLAVAALMATWWLSEALPLAATSLLPLLLFPLLGAKSTSTTAQSYMDRNIVLFMGGFFVAMAMQRWNLHRRVALYVVRGIGSDGRRLVLGFMVATAALSMWISNTATAMMMLPIALAVVGERESRAGDTEKIAPPLLLGVAFAASIGGTATLIGTPPNIVLANAVQTLYPEAPPIGFLQWMLLGVPLAVLFLPIVWLYLTRVAFPIARTGPTSSTSVAREIKALGPLSRGELCVLIVFVLTAMAWVTRADLRIGSVTFSGWTTLFGFEGVDDATVAIGAALVLFSIPTSLADGHFLLNWEWARRIPWSVLILFGGGIALARGFSESGLADWIGARLTVLGAVPLPLIVVLVCLLITFLTEVTSNTATATLFMPIMGATAVSVNSDPLLLMIPAALSASCAFMLPVATPPNAIIFGSRRVSLPEMARTGFLLNFVGVLIISTLIFLLAIPVFDISVASLPEWL